MATYSIIHNGLGGFAVEVRFPSGHVETKEGFWTEAEAQSWLADRQGEIARRKGRD